MKMPHHFETLSISTHKRGNSKVEICRIVLIAKKKESGVWPMQSRALHLLQIYSSCAVFYFVILFEKTC